MMNKYVEDDRINVSFPSFSSYKYLLIYRIQWRVQRKATAKIFTNTNFRTIITNSLRADLETLHSVLNNYSATGEEFDLSALFHAFTLSSFSHMAFGLQIGVLTTEGVQNVPFGEFSPKIKFFAKLTQSWFSFCFRFCSDYNVLQNFESILETL